MSSSGILGIALVYILLIISVVGLMIAAWALLLRKAGEGWWKVFIPVYGTYTQYKVADSTGIFWGMIITSGAYSVISWIISMVAANSVRSYRYGYGYYDTSGSLTALMVLTIIYLIVIVLFHIFFCIHLADAFNRNGGFACGLIFLYPIFLLILAFGPAEYKYRYTPGGSSLDRYQATTETWKCPNCGTENPKYRGTCSECGHIRT